MGVFCFVVSRVRIRFVFQLTTVTLLICGVRGTGGGRQRLFGILSGYLYRVVTCREAVKGFLVL